MMKAYGNKPVIYVDKQTLDSLKKSFNINTTNNFIFTVHADFVLNGGDYEGFVAGTQWTAEECEVLKKRQKELNDMAGPMVNRKYEWATPEAKSDKQFLMWLWSRLHQVFGESENIGYMQRLDAIISGMPGNGRIDIIDEGKFDIYRKGKLVHSDD